MPNGSTCDLYFIFGSRFFYIFLYALPFRFILSRLLVVLVRSSITDIIWDTNVALLLLFSLARAPTISFNDFSTCSLPPPPSVCNSLLRRTVKTTEKKKTKRKLVKTGGKRISFEASSSEKKSLCKWSLTEINPLTKKLLIRQNFLLSMQKIFYFLGKLPLNIDNRMKSPKKINRFAANFSTETDNRYICLFFNCWFDVVLHFTEHITWTNFGDPHFCPNVNNSSFSINLD